MATFGPFAPLVGIITFTQSFTIARCKEQEVFFFGGITPLSGTTSLFIFFCAFLGGFMVMNERMYTNPYTKEIIAETTRLSSDPTWYPSKIQSCQPMLYVLKICSV